MKKNYISPRMATEFAECAMMVAASILTTEGNSQSIQFTEEEHEGEFSVKEYTFGDDL